MRNIRIIRKQEAAGDRGPSRGMFALQRALEAANFPWLKIGGELQPDEIPWIWHWDDKWFAVRCEASRRPYILGPNVLFHSSAQPCEYPAESYLCHAKHCCLLVTESRWYEVLIQQHLGRGNETPIAVWPYPIDMMPNGSESNQPARYDLMIYNKCGQEYASTVRALQSAFPSHCLVEYGRYRRDRMIVNATRSRCCVYLSADDRGPIALAEILLCGCPAGGVERGAPWLNGVNGVVVPSLDPIDLIEGAAQAMTFDRDVVREMAAATFNPDQIAKRVAASLLPLLS